MEVSSPTSPVDVERMAGHATFTLGAQAFRVASTMLLTVLVSRFLGAEALGMLTLGLTLATTATIVACAGVDQGIMYFVARAQPAHGSAAPREQTRHEIPPTQGDGQSARPISPRETPEAETAREPVSSSPAAIRTALVITGTGGLVLGALAGWLAPLVAGPVFGAPELLPVLLILAPTIPLAAMFAAALGALQGSFRVVHRAILEWIMFPLLTLTLAAALLLAGRGVAGVAVGYLSAWAASALLAVAIALRMRGNKRPLIFRKLLVFSLPLMFSLLTGYLLFHIDVLMLGGFASVREVGLYSVATRLALPLFLVLDSIARAFAPLAAHLYSHHQMERLGTVYAAATEWILAINVPAGVFIALYARPILRLFGAEFVAAAGSLRVLCLGIVLATACGGAASMLTMTRWQRLEMTDNFLLLVLNVILNLLLVPRLGALGAALATASAATSVYALKVVQVRWLLSLQPIRLRQAAAVSLALLAAGISWASTRSLDIGLPAELAARAGVFSLVYATTWWRWGCSTTSREVLQTIVRRTR